MSNNSKQIINIISPYDKIESHPADLHCYRGLVEVRLVEHCRHCHLVLQPAVVELAARRHSGLVLVVLHVHPQVVGATELAAALRDVAGVGERVGVDHLVHLERAERGEVPGAGDAQVGPLAGVRTPVDVDAALPGEAPAAVAAQVGLEAGVHPAVRHQVLASAEHLLALVAGVGALAAMHHQVVGLHDLPDDVAAAAVRAHVGLGHGVHLVLVAGQQVQVGEPGRALLAAELEAPLGRGAAALLLLGLLHLLAGLLHLLHLLVHHLLPLRVQLRGVGAPGVAGSTGRGGLDSQGQSVQQCLSDGGGGVRVRPAGTLVVGTLVLQEQRRHVVLGVHSRRQRRRQGALVGVVGAFVARQGLVAVRHGP